MLPSRLFRNTGISPRLRSLLVPSPSLPPTISTQLRFSLSVRYQSSNNAPSCSAPPSSSTPSDGDSPGSASLQAPGVTTSQTFKLETEEPRLSITFTCTVPNCNERSTHQFAKKSYEKGIVIVQCPGCKNRHLIADHLGWFKDSTQEGKLRTIEDIVGARGETVRRGRLHADGDIEYTPDQ